jgi:oligopeptide/dipeptide ABC transporter ATP-binding protein
LSVEENGDLASVEENAEVASVETGATADERRGPDGTPLLAVEHLRVLFPIKSGTVINRRIGYVHAVDDVSFALQEGETLGIVGESGCGKTTLIRTLVRLVDATDGTIRFRGTDITKADRSKLAPIRREMQMVFQDPQASLNPRKRVNQIIATPLRIRGVPKNKFETETRGLLDKVGLHPEHLNRFPHEFSGGQRQRIGIARALVINPKLVICDEPVSALDVSVQAQILNLLKDLQKDFDLTYIFIAHDLNVVRHVSDRVMVMYLGQPVETALKQDLYTEPKHPYTGALLSAVPIAEPTAGRARKQIVLTGDVPSPLNPPSACRFHPRCPRFVDGKCNVDDPELTPLPGQPEHRFSCHFPLERWPMDEDEIRRRPAHAGTTEALAESAAE